MIVRTFLVALLGCALGYSVHAQTPAEPAPLRIRYLSRDPAKAPLPPFVHLRIEMENRHDDPRWILFPFDSDTRLPEKGMFKAEPDEGFPFMVSKTEDDQGKSRVVTVFFLGEPRCVAFLLPAKAKILLENYEIPSADDIAAIDWIEAKSLLVNGKTPLESVLEVPVASSTAAIVVPSATWTTVPLNDKSAKVTGLVAEGVRRGRLTVEGFTAAARFYHPLEIDQTPQPDASWKPIGTFRSTKPLKVESLAFAPDGSWIAASLQTFKVVGLDLVKRQERVFPMGEKALARFFAFTPEGNLLVKQATNIDQEDGNLDLADWSTGKILDVLRSSSRGTLGSNDHVPTPNGRRVAIANRGSFNVWDFDKLETVGRYAWPADALGFTYRAGTYSPDGRLFAAGLESTIGGGKVLLWDATTGKLLDSFVNKQAGFHYVAFSADGKFLAAASKQSNAVAMWNTTNLADLPGVRDLPFSNIHALALSPDGKTVIVAATNFSGIDATRPLDWRFLGKDRESGTLAGLRQPISALAFSRDGRRFAAGDNLGTVKVWERD